MVEIITEDYVSFETAKLLKERGFNEKCQKVYMHNGQLLWAPIFMEGESFVNNEDIELVANYIDWNTHTQGDYAYLCPTLQMAMKWLREVHNIDIIAPPQYDNIKWTYSAIIFKLSIPCTEIRLNDNKDKKEQACEAAIKYCLEHLIK